MEVFGSSACFFLVSLVSVDWRYYSSVNHEFLDLSDFPVNFAVSLFAYIFLSTYEKKSLCHMVVWKLLQILRKTMEYENWKKALELWTLYTDLSKWKWFIAVHLDLWENSTAQSTAS